MEIPFWGSLWKFCAFMVVLRKFVMVLCFVFSFVWGGRGCEKNFCDLFGTNSQLQIVFRIFFSRMCQR